MRCAKSIGVWVRPPRSVGSAARPLCLELGVMQSEQEREEGAGHLRSPQRRDRHRQGCRLGPWGARRGWDGPPGFGTLPNGTPIHGHGSHEYYSDPALAEVLTVDSPSHRGAQPRPHVGTQDPGLGRQHGPASPGSPWSASASESHPNSSRWSPHGVQGMRAHDHGNPITRSWRFGNRYGG